MYACLRCHAVQYKSEHFFELQTKQYFGICVMSIKFYEYFLLI